MNFFDRLTDDWLELILIAPQKCCEGCCGCTILDIEDILNLARTSRRVLERHPIIKRLWWTAGPFQYKNVPWNYVDFYYNWTRRRGDRYDVDCYKLFGALSKDVMTKFMRKSRDDKMCEWTDIYETWYQIRTNLYPALAAYRWAHNLIHRSYGAARKRLYDPSNPFERAVEIWTENWYSLMINKYEPERTRNPVFETVYPSSPFHLRDAGHIEVRIDGVVVAALRFSWESQTYSSRSEVRAHFISLFPLPPQITTITAEQNASTTTTTTRSWTKRRSSPLPKGRQARSTSGGTRPIRTRERWRRARNGRNGRRQNGHHAFR